MSPDLVYFCKSSLQAFNQGKLVCGFIFDVLKVFDKMWIYDLIYILFLLKMPNKLGSWIKKILTNRSFYVKINEDKSGQYEILTGVPQGAILSPTLSSILINDIINLNEYPNNTAYSLFFADDLFTFIIDQNTNRLKVQMQRYLNSLESLLNKWRLSISANKCSFTIYSKGNITKCKVKL